MWLIMYKMGDNCVIVGQSGIAGSATLGERVVCWGKVGVAGQFTIGSDSQIMSGSLVISDVPEKTKMMGYPAHPHKDFINTRQRCVVL